MRFGAVFLIAFWFGWMLGKAEGLSIAGRTHTLVPTDPDEPGSGAD